jgi:2,3-bisphosphoglycerate-dependent phosphoglycerate mutase
VLKKIYLVRHCSADGQHKDSPLTHEGIRQARLLSSFFNDQNIHFDRIISSPYLRAVESIKPFAENVNMEIEVNDNLKERILSDEPIDDWLDVLSQSFTDLDFSLHGGESGNDALNRANSVLHHLLTDNTVSNGIIVSHGNLITLLLQQYDSAFGFDQWKRLRNPDVYVINGETEPKTVECVWSS